MQESHLPVGNFVQSAPRFHVQWISALATKQLVASTIPQQLAALPWQRGWTMEVDTTELLCHTQRGGQHAQQLLWRWRDSIAREWKLGAGRLLAIATDANNQLLMLHLHRRYKLHTTCNHR